MASLKEYCENLSTSQLRSLLREECEGRGNLPVQAILDICEILSQREPDKPSVKEVLCQLCRAYL